MKKIFSIFLAFTLVMVLTGCGQSGGTGKTVPGGADMPKVTGHTQSNETTQPAVETQMGLLNWGVSLSAEEVTPTGLTIICEQNGGELNGELNASSYYFLEVYDNNGWDAVAHLPQEYDVSWTDEAWMIPENDIVEWKVDWKWLYGELPIGEYRIGKSFMDFVETGNYEEQTYYATFEIQ